MSNELEQYRAAAKMMPGSVIIFQLQADDAIKILFYSPKARELIRMSPLEENSSILENALCMVLADDRGVVIEKIKSAVLQHEEADVIFRWAHKVQGVAWIHMKAAVAGEVAGRPVFLAALLDVTHEMLNSSSIMEASDRSICVIEKHSKLLLYGNSKFYELIDRKPSESMGLYCYEALCGNPAFKNDNNCLCFSTININKPFEYYNPDNKTYLSMYGREIMWGEHEAYAFYITDQTEEKFKDKQLKNAQERFEMTLDNSDLFIWEYDIVNSQCINSRKAVRDYGVPLVIDNYPESLYDMGHTPPETVEQIKDVKRRLLSGESDFSVERRTIDINGDSQWMKVSYTLETDGNGRPIRALVCGTDITEQKKKQFEYEEEIRLKKSVASDMTVLAILNITKNRVAENDAENPALAKYLNLDTIDASVGAICDAFIADSDAAAYRARFSCSSMMAAYESGALHGALRHQFKHRAGWFESGYDLLLNPTTGDVEAIITIKDVSDIVRSHQVVNKLTSIDYDKIMTLDVGSGEIFCLGREGDNDTSYGKKMAWGDYAKESLDYLQQNSTHEETERVAALTNKAVLLERLKNAPLYTVMYTLTIDGQSVKKRNIYTYLDQSHKTILCARQDVTETYLQEEKQKRELSEALEKANVASHAKTAFLSHMSHDIRTPLNGIIGMTDVAIHDNKDEKVTESLELIASSSRFLLSLINNILDISKIENGSLTLKEKPTALSDFDEIIHSVICPLMNSKDIEFVYHMHCGMHCACIDAVRFNQVFLNLLSNASKYTPVGGKVEFLAEHLSETAEIEWVRFIVRDNGIGMAPAFCAHAFDAFEQEETANAHLQNHGTGLGLAISKELVELMGGKISVKSTLGKGTEFTVDLPLKKAETPEKQAENEIARNPDECLAGKRVLLVEDNRINAVVAIRLLEAKEMQVELAENGEVAVDKFTEAAPGRYDVILMDMRMPVMDGVTATRVIRAMPGRADAQAIPIIAMTANAFDEDVVACLQAGMNAHLSKPIEPKKMYQTIAAELH